MESKTNSLYKCAYDKIVDIDLLQPHPRNPNKHPDNQIQYLAKILAHQGWRHPVTVSNRSGFIIAGHGRLLAAKYNGWTEVPVDYQDFDCEADEYAHLVADNKIAELATVDMSMVNADVLELGLNIDFDLELLGVPDFDFEDLDKVEKVNQGDENSEWVGMPEFNKGEDYIKLIIHFSTEDKRKTWCEERGFEPDRKMNNQWIMLL